MNRLRRSSSSSTRPWGELNILVNDGVGWFKNVAELSVEMGHNHRNEPYRGVLLLATERPAIRNPGEGLSFRRLVALPGKMHSQGRRPTIASKFGLNGYLSGSRHARHTLSERARLDHRAWKRRHGVRRQRRIRPPETRQLEASGQTTSPRSSTCCCAFRRAPWRVYVEVRRRSRLASKRFTSKQSLVADSRGHRGIRQRRGASKEMALGLPENLWKGAASSSGSLKRKAADKMVRLNVPLDPAKTGREAMLSRWLVCGG